MFYPWSVLLHLPSYRAGVSLSLTHTHFRKHTQSHSHVSCVDNCVLQGEGLRVGLYRNGRVVSLTLDQYLTSDLDQASGGSVLTLAAGDQVWLEVSLHSACRLPPLTCLYLSWFYSPASNQAASMMPASTLLALFCLHPLTCLYSSCLYSVCLYLAWFTRLHSLCGN